MKSIGEKLKEARTARELDLDQVARETNISKRYLEALENEKFEEFPGDSYLIGFLRNYCDYLDLDATEIVGLYKNQKIQEINVPMSALIPPRPLHERVFRRGAGRLLVALVVIVVLAGLGFGGYVLLQRFPLEGFAQTQRNEASSTESTAAVHEMTSSQFRGRVFAGDSIMVPVEGTIFSIAVQETSPAVKIETGGAVRVVELGQEILFDVSGDSIPDIRVFVSDLDANDPGAGAEIALDVGPFEQTEGALDPSGALAAQGSSSTQTVLFESASAYPVTLNATFRGNCLFRYEVDRSEREERLYQRSEVLTVQARDGLRVWASNGNAVQLQIIAGGRTVDLELSRPGEVIVKDLRWFRDSTTGRYNFAVMDVE